MGTLTLCVAAFCLQASDCTGLYAFLTPDRGGMIGAQCGPAYPVNQEFASGGGEYDVEFAGATWRACQIQVLAILGDAFGARIWCRGVDAPGVEP